MIAILAFVLAAATDPLAVGPLHVGETFSAAVKSLGPAREVSSPPCKHGYECSKEVHYRSGSRDVGLMFGSDRLEGIALGPTPANGKQVASLSKGVSDVANWRWMGHRALGAAPAVVSGFVRRVANGGVVFNRQSIGLQAWFAINPIVGKRLFLLGRE